MDYYEKYLKYKNKYILTKLNKQKGGVLNPNWEILFNMYNITDPNIKDYVIRYVKSWCSLQNLIYWQYGQIFENDYEYNPDIPDITRCDSITNCDLNKYCILYKKKKCIPKEKLGKFKKGVIIKDKEFNQSFTFFDYVILSGDIVEEIVEVKILNMDKKEDFDLYYDLYTKKIIYLFSTNKKLYVSYLFIDSTGNLFVLLNSGFTENNLEIIESELFRWETSEDITQTVSIRLQELEENKKNLLKLLYKNFFNQLYSKIKLFLINFPYKKIILCGHSHGAVLAHLLNCYLYSLKDITMENVYVIGSGSYRSLRKEMPISPTNVKINFVSSIVEKRSGKIIYDPLAYDGNSYRIILSPSFILNMENPCLYNITMPQNFTHEGNYTWLHQWDEYIPKLKYVFFI
jgi:hypothetical protein